MKFACRVNQRGGLWHAEYQEKDRKPVRVSAATREEALSKLEGEIRYTLEFCACSGEMYRDVPVELEVVE